MCRPVISRQVVAGAVLAFALAATTSPAYADNPIVQHVYTADPAPMVDDDTVYLCTSHDEDVTIDDFFTMNDWFVFSSKDMVNWTDHGIPLSWETFSWAEANKSWAPHCVQRNGKYYFYVPVNDKIGVAVADSPQGPFEDAIGAPLLTDYRYIDPTVFIDDDGQAYLYFGNPKLWYVELNEDMISYSGGIQEVPMTVQSFGQRRGGPTEDRPTGYEEGPWFYKRNGLYYLVYPTGELPEHIAYSTSPGPMGPWTYGGEIMSNESGHAFTNHPAVIDFKGHSYFFYHTQELPGGGGFKRSVAVEEFAYDADGSIPTIAKTSEGVTQSVDPLDPYSRVEGETMAWGSGIEVEDCSEGGRNVTQIEDGDSIKVESVNFRTGPLLFEASVASGSSGGEIELRVDEVDGMLLGACSVPSTGGWQDWETVSCDVGEVEDVHDLFLVFSGGGGSLFNLDFWQFVPRDPLLDGSGGASGTGGVGGGTATGGATAAGGSHPGGGRSGGGSGGVRLGAGGHVVAGGTGGELSGSAGGRPNGAAGGGGLPSGTGSVSSTGAGGENYEAGKGGCTVGLSPGGALRWSWLVAGLLMLAMRALRSRRGDSRTSVVVGER